MELFILTVKPIENKYARTLIFFAYFCNKQIPYPSRIRAAEDGSIIQCFPG